MTTNAVIGAVESERGKRIPIAGTYNLRDAGGYSCDGGTVRNGRLFRSDALHALNDEGRESLGDIGIRHIIDLRHADEREQAPNAVGGFEIQLHECPIVDAASSRRQATTSVSLADVYNAFANDFASNLIGAVRIVAAVADEPVLVHCTAGKDRTGLVIALILAAVGVAQSDIVADYSRSEEYLRGEWTDAMLAKYTEQFGTLTPEVTELVSASPATVIDSLLTRIVAEHGSIPLYLSAHGLTDDESNALRTALVEPATA